MSAFETFDADSVRHRLLTYLRQQTGDDVEIGALHRYTVGFSWVTFGFAAKWTEDGHSVERDLILRVGPPSGIFAPYHATPEFLTLRSFAHSGVPVPRAYWYSDDSEALGAPFFVCEFVEGRPPFPGGRRRSGFDEAARTNLGEQFVEALAALHRFEWRVAPSPVIGGATDRTKTAAPRSTIGRGACAQWSRAAFRCSNGH